MKTSITSRVILNAIFLILSLCCLIPFFIIIMVSISSEQDVAAFGYQIIPQHISFDAYKALFTDAEAIFRAILLTLASAFGGTAISLTLCAMMAYPMAQQDFKFNKFVTYYMLITMLFSGGLMPSYIINTTVLGLKNNILVYFILTPVVAWTVILFRTFFKQIPKALIESASIDGASQYKILLKIIIPMSKPIVGMQFVLGAVQKWNDWTVPLYYINDEKLYNIQYLLQRIVNELSYLKELYKDNPAFGSADDIPVKTMQFALCVIAIVPILIIFPFVQKYFSKGIAVGSVKG